MESLTSRSFGPRPLCTSSRADLIVGVAPNGARRVVVRTQGAVETAQVVKGVFVLRDSIVAPPDSIVPR